MKFNALTDRFSRGEMEKALRRIIELEKHFIDNGEEPPGGRSTIKMESLSDPRTRIKPGFGESIEFRAVYISGSFYHGYQVYQWIPGGISRFPDDIQEPAGYWRSRAGTFKTAEEAVDALMRLQNGVEVDPKYAPL